MAADAVKATWVREAWSGCRELHAQCLSAQRQWMSHLPDHPGFPRRRIRQIEYGISGAAVWSGQSSSGIGGFNGSHRDGHHPFPQPEPSLDPVAGLIVNDYASHLSLLFLADEPLRALSARFPGLVDAQTVLLPIAERPASRLTAPMLTPNGIIAFADGVELIGAKKRMKAMHALLGR